MYSHINYSCHNFTMLTVTNSGYKRLTENCILSLININFPLEKIIIYAMDTECQQYFKDKYPSITVKLNDFIKKEHERYLQKDWNNITMQKINIISKEFDNYEYLILFDGDIVFNKLDFVDYMLKTMNEDKSLDLLAQQEFKGNNINEICSGFYILRSSQNTQKYFNTELFTQNTQHTCNDQTYINRLRPNLNWKYLPIELFPNGKYFYEYHPDEAHIIHFNFVMFNDKEGRMKKYKKWFL